MGMYLETGGLHGKTEALAKLLNGEIISEPSSFDPPEGKTLVCVVTNPMFEAAAICYDDQEFQAFRSSPDDGRPRKWLLTDSALVASQNEDYASFWARKPKKEEEQ